MTDTYPWREGTPKRIAMPQDTDYLTLPQARVYLNLGRDKMDDLRENDPDFPKPFQPGPRKTMFRRSELDAYMDLKRASA